MIRLAQFRLVDLESGEDTDLVLTSLAAGWETAYSPSLKLTHLIPSWRLEIKYLARLQHSNCKTLVKVLRRHNASPWGTIPKWTLPIRIIRAWFRLGAWKSPTNYLYWRSAVGLLKGRCT